MVPFPTDLSESDCDDDLLGTSSQDVHAEEYDDTDVHVSGWCKT